MWNELVTSALIGTERRAFTLDDLPEAFRELAAQFEGEDAERKLLLMAGTMALYRRAGQAPQIDNSPLPDPCPPDPVPPCTPRAGQILHQILAISNYGAHLPEWIALAYNAHQRVIVEHLPRMLSNFEKSAHLPDQFYDMIGVRGRWLAQQNPVWAYAVLPESDADWEIANINARVHVLRQLRASDPAHAQALVEAIWSSEKAETRMEFLRAYEIGLSLDDEPFLEAALDDRSINVRAVAAELLPALNGSAYQERMIARAQPLIQIERKRKKLNIAVHLPNACDESMIRDGIPAEPPKKSNLPDNTYWLANIAAQLPSSYWLSGDWSARELVEAVNDNHNWRGVLLECLAQMAEREGQHDFADALLDTELDEQIEFSVLRTASPAAREAYVMRSKPVGAKGDEHFRFLNRYCDSGYLWSRDLTRAIIHMLAQSVPSKGAAEISVMTWHLPRFAMKMSPDCVTDLEALGAIENKSKPAWTRAVKEAVSTLEFRQKMLKEFSK